MKKKTVCLLIGLSGSTLSGCIIYPRFGHVYVSPELAVVVVNSSKKPVAKAQVIYQSYHHWEKYDVGETDDAGRFYFPARRRFRVLDIFVMDPPRYRYGSQVFIKTANDSQYVRDYHCYGGRRKQTITDTLPLNEKTRLRFHPHITWR